MASIFRHFILNSDYPTIKEITSFDKTLSVSNQTLGADQQVTKYVDVTVPVGKYITNVNMSFSGSGYQTINTTNSTLVYQGEAGQYGVYQIVVGLARTSNTNYRIFANIYMMLPDGSATVNGFNVRVRCHLFSSPFTA